MIIHILSRARQAHHCRGVPHLEPPDDADAPVALGPPPQQDARRALLNDPVHGQPADHRHHRQPGGGAGVSSVRHRTEGARRPPRLRLQAVLLPWNVLAETGLRPPGDELSRRGALPPRIEDQALWEPGPLICAAIACSKTRNGRARADIYDR